MFATPVGVILSIFLPLAYLQLVTQINPFTALVSNNLVLCWVVGGIVVTIGITKLPLFYLDRKKHQISKTKYKPITGVCMCDLSQLRSHVRKMEKSKAIGERMRHAKLVKYYKQQIGWTK
jgi:beta-lactamase regulating signal transducer with metallopeptidase domain